MSEPKPDRSCAEILALLLEHGTWYASAIEGPAGWQPGIDFEALEAEARRAVERETGKPGKPAPEGS